MASKLNPYLNFKDTTRQAMEFYKTVFGGELTLTTFTDGHVPADMGDGNLIMHAVLITDNGFTLMAADTAAQMETQFGNNVQISLSGDNETELRGYWDKLAEGATIRQPLNKAPWGDTFGMLIDKFGIYWLVNIATPKS